MANLEKQFNDFIEKVYISNKSEKSNQLRVSRDNARKKIKDFFQKKGEKVPDFKMQGSFKMNTIITPLDDEYDLDDGVYLNNLEGSVDEWKNPDTFHSWIREAISGITDEKPIDKKTCVRLKFKKQYHIDFPIYGISENKQYYAVSGQKWKGNENYPQEYLAWFNDLTKNNDQVRKIVILLKAWNDFQQSKNTSIKLPAGVVLTTLVGKYYQQDDEIQYAFFYTLEAIYNMLSTKFIIERPVKPYNNFFEGYPNTRKEYFLSKLKGVIDDKKSLIDESDIVKASECWRKHLGDRVPLAEKPQGSSYSATIGNQRSA